MYTSPRVIAIDDDTRHLSGLVTGLNSHGVACLSIHFTNEPIRIRHVSRCAGEFSPTFISASVLWVPIRMTDFAVIGALSGEHD